jgi:isoamylase
MQSHDWENPSTRSLALMLSGRDESLLMLFNADADQITFRLPAPMRSGWGLLIDTAKGTAKLRSSGPLSETEIEMPERSLILLESRK